MGSEMAPAEPDKIAYQTPEIKKNLGNIKVVTRNTVMLGTGDVAWHMQYVPTSG